MSKCLFFALVASLLLSSCVIQHPKYARVADTYKVETGMAYNEVNEVLRVQPFALKERTDTSVTFNYKFRVEEVKRLPLVMRRNKGVDVESRFVDMFITYNNDSLVTHMESCNYCSDDGEKEQRVDVAALISDLTIMITVTIPVALALLANNN